jgi:hypothetical protein
VGTRNKDSYGAKDVAVYYLLKRIPDMIKVVALILCLLAVSAVCIFSVWVFIFEYCTN